MTTNIFSQSLNFTSESALEAITQSDDSTTISICPDLNELTATIQQDYSDYKHGLPSNSKSLNDYDPAAVYSCGSFTIVYADIDQNTGEGYDDGNLGAPDFNLDPRRDAEYADFIAVYSILFNKATTGDTTLTQNEQNTLELIAYKHSTLAAGLARVTLHGYTGIPFLETLVEPEIELTPKSMQNKAKAPEIKTCKVYPNPTAGILLVEIPLAFKEVEVTVRDGNGKIVHNEVVGSGMVTLNLRQLSSGSYILHLLASDGTLDEIHQIQVAK